MLYTQQKALKGIMCILSFYLFDIGTLCVISIDGLLDLITLHKKHDPSFPLHVLPISWAVNDRLKYDNILIDKYTTRIILLIHPFGGTIDFVLEIK